MTGAGYGKLILYLIINRMFYDWEGKLEQVDDVWWWLLKFYIVFLRADRLGKPV